jgi:shikimate kinase
VTADGHGQPGLSTFPLVILIGPPGAGKTTVGGELAARLDVRFTDTDASVAAAAGKPVSDIFIEDGESAFRELEREAVAAAIAEHDGVVGLGGGAILDPGTRDRLAGRPVVYLRTSFPELAKRVGMDRARPLLVGNPRAQLKALLDQRLPIYESLAWLTVDTDGRDPVQVAEQIAEQIAVAVAGERPPRPGS